MSLEFLVHVGGPAFLGLLGGGVIGAAHYYATKPMPIKEPDSDTGIRNTALLSYRPAAMGALHDLISYGVARRATVLKIRNAMEELEAMVVFCETAPVGRIPAHVVAWAQKVEYGVRETLHDELRRHGHVFVNDAPGEVWLREVHACIVTQMHDCIRNMESIMRQRLNSDVIGEGIVRGMAQIDREVRTHMRSGRGGSTE